MLKAISTITNALGALNYKGTWNASSNTPTLADGTGAKGDYYVVSTAGTQTFGGLQLFFGIGDWIVYNGAVWQRVEGGSDGNFANVTMTSTDAGAAAAPLLDLYRDSASPAASDTLGEIEFNGEDSAGNKQQYAVIHASILSATSTAETGQIHFETATAGASTEKMIIGSSNLVINDIGAIYNVRIEGDADANLFFTDATNDRIGVGTITPSFKLDVNGTLRATTITGNGSYTNTGQAAFLAHNSTDDANQTGAGAVATLGCNLEIFDQGNNYNNSTFIFTAPVTGRYRFSAQAYLYNITALATGYELLLITSNRNYRRLMGSVGQIPTAITISIDSLTDMDAGDTAYVGVLVTGMAGNTVNIYGEASDIYTFFSGEQVC